MIKLIVNTRSSNNGTGKTLYTLTFFNEITLNLKYDAIASTFKFKMYFNPDDRDHAELAGVSHFHECKIYYVHDKPGTYATSEKNGTPIFTYTHDQLLITGFVLSQLFEDSPAPTWCEIGGYSKPGVLGDCDFPTSVKLQSVGLSFRQIVNNNVVPLFSNPADGGFKFYIKSSAADQIFETDPTKKATQNKLGLPGSIADLIAAIDTDSGDPIEKTTAPESQNILSYLKELAVIRGLILSSDIFGNLIVNKPNFGAPYLFKIGTDDGIPYLKLNSNFNGQAIHSQVEAIGQPDKDGGNMAYALVKNPLCPVVYRPKVITMNTGDNNDANKAALAEIGTELKSIPLTIDLHSPIVNNQFITTNNMIQVVSKKAYIYKPSDWFIEEVNYTKNSKEEKCTVTAVLPGVYGGPLINVFVPAGKDSPLDK